MNFEPNFAIIDRYRKQKLVTVFQIIIYKLKYRTKKLSKKEIYVKLKATHALVRYPIKTVKWAARLFSDWSLHIIIIENRTLKAFFSLGYVGKNDYICGLDISDFNNSCVKRQRITHYTAIKLASGKLDI